MRQAREILWNKIFARPAIPAAVYMACVLALTFATGSYLVSFAVTAAVLVMVIKERSYCRQYVTFILLTAVFSMLLSLRMAGRLNSYEDTGMTDCEVYIVSAQHKLNGRSSYTAALPSGAAAVINIDNDDIFISPGSKIAVTGRLSLPSKATNPGEFDYRKYLMTKGVRYSIAAEDIVPCEQTLLSRAAGMIDSAVFRFRSWLYELLISDLDDGSKAMMTALWLGDDSLIDRNVRSSFTLTSCSHLLAVSGTHFSGFMAFILAVLDLFDRKGKHKAVLVLFCLATAVMTGFNDSVTRALIMSVCLIFARDRLSGMCIALLVMMTSDPFAVMQSGLLMSMAACFGIICWGKEISRFMIIRNIPEKIATAVSAVIAAHLGLLPLAGVAGIRLSVAGLVCQMAGGVIVSIICIVFMPVLVLRLAGITFASSLTETLAELLTGVTGACADMSGGAVNCGRAGSYLFTGIFLLAVILRFPPGVIRKALFKPLFAVAAICAGMIVVTLGAKPEMELLFIDVGQGDCCLLITPDSSLLIDGGTYEKGEVIAQVLDWYGIRRVDAAVVTHWDGDHCGGIAYLYGNGRIGKVLCPCSCVLGPDDDGHIEDTVGISAGTVIDLSEKARINVLWPYSVTDGRNEDSLVMELDCGGLKCLFTGDIGAETEEKLVNSGAIGDCDILKVSHHGSRFSSGDMFISRASPEIAVISCGRHNSYGHPSRETLERLALHGVDIRRTDLEGAVRFEIKTTY